MLVRFIFLNGRYAVGLSLGREYLCGYDVTGADTHGNWA